MIKNYKIIKYMLFATILSILLISCTTDTETVEVIKEVEVVKEIPVEVVKEVEKSRGNLVIYSGRKESLIGPIIDQFKSIAVLMLK